VSKAIHFTPKVDYGYAERIAWLASEHGWDYWLDVHDPGLTVINSRLLSPQSQALAVALIIEVALLNCTHVLATITDNSPGSAWIPYEYGRVQEIKGVRHRLLTFGISFDIFHGSWDDQRERQMVG